MGRNLNPRAKRARRIGERLIAHGEKALSRRPYPPGQHGPKGASRISEYGVRLREKQKAQLIYGLLERQFRRYVGMAKRRVGDTGEFLLQLLEQRLDNMVYRGGFAISREAGRQLVRHGHILVNGKRVNQPSYHVLIGDLITFTKSAKNKPIFQACLKRLENFEPPAWIELDKSTATTKMTSVPTAPESAPNINPQLIVEFYSR